MIYILEQNREFITAVNSAIRINKHDKREIIVREGGIYRLLGAYETPERAKKVVQDMWDEIKYWEYYSKCIYFEMPKE